MFQNNFQNIDKIVKKKASLEVFEYNVDSWKRMEELFEKKKKRRFIIWYWVFGLGISLGTVILTINQFYNETQKEGSLIEESLETNKTNIIENKPIMQERKPDKQKKIVSDYQKHLNNNSRNIKGNTKEEIGNYGIKRNSIVLKKNTYPFLIKEQPIKEKSINYQELIKTIKSDQKNKETKKKDLSKAEVKSKDNLNAVDHVFTDTIVLENDVTVHDTLLVLKDSNSLDKTIKKKKDKITSITTHYFGIHAGIEATSIKLSRFDKLGYRFGLEYKTRFLNRFQVGTGLSYSKKIYTANREEYSPPPGFWRNRVIPKSTSAICNLLEIPISFGYHFNGYNKKGIFLDAGIVSYLMFKEYYQFDQKDNSAFYTQEWQTKELSEYWFGVLQVQIGYQKILKNGNQISFSPFLHLPLQDNGFGIGNAQFYSLGASFQYGLNSR